jgi:GTPase SAR1 family protein
MRPQHYSNGYGDDDDDFETEAPPSYAATLESITLGRDAENKQLLDQVDLLRECRVDEYIDLPQVVVVGDQSTGKSSVLESLTTIPFPTSSVKCTRYATQIRLRRTDQVRTKVSILADQGATVEEKKRLAGFKQVVDERADFDTIFTRAMETIFPAGPQHNFLSKHILSIQISGPTQPHLTVVDLPGIIHAATAEQTEDDKVAIVALARYYMEKERTIILPVVSGSNDISNQAVLSMVKEIDRKGVRTLGIITKPDMTLTEARQLEFINLACNKDKRNKLQLGWHVLRNRAHDEENFTPEERNRAEKEFFAGDGINWSKKLHPDQLGVDALSKRLSTQLIRHIAAEVFKVKDEIKSELDKCREKLSELGEGKDTPEEMRTDIYRWSERSLRLTQAAIQGHGINPSGEDFFPSFDDGKTYARNFRSRVVKQNQIFTAQMEDWGASYIITEDGQQSGHRNGKSTIRPNEDTAHVREISRSDYLKKIVHPLIQDNPGQELSMDTNALLVYRLFQSYSENWITHATQHISNVHKLCEEYLNQVLQYAWPKRIQYRIWGGFIQSEIESMRQNAKRELDKIKADRMKLITPYETEFLRKWYEWKESDLTNQPNADLAEQRYEELLRKMLLLYQVILRTCS